MSYLKLCSKTAAVTLGVVILSCNSVFAASVGTITGNNVNIRSGSSDTASVVSTVAGGDAVTVVSEEDGWFKITSPVTDEAYVAEDYVTITKADGKVIANTVNIRTAPELDAEIIGTANTGDTLTVIGTVNDEWYAVEYCGTTAYIYSEYVQGKLIPYLNGTTAYVDNSANGSSDDIYAVVKSSDLNMRSLASTESDVIKRLPEGYTLNVLGYENGWVNVSDDSGRTGFVKSDYIDLKNGEKPVNSPSGRTSKKLPTIKGSGSGKEIVEYAEQFIGTPYVYGGSDLESGVDCSGFTYAVYKHFGIDLERCSRDQISDGMPVSRSELQAGDLVFFNTGDDSPISHVGMYIGDDQYIHSTDAQNYIGVTISDLDSDYSSSTYVGACRIVE